MTIEIRAFDTLNAREVYDMIRIREEIFVLEQDCVYVDCDNNDPACDIMLVWEKGQLIGTLRIMPSGVKYNDVSIGRVVVVKKARGRGIALEMMNRSVEFIKEKYGPVDIVLSGQVIIKSLYEKAGFKVISGIYKEDGIDHVKMKYQFDIQN